MRGQADGMLCLLSGLCKGLKHLHHCRCFSGAAVEVIPLSPGLGIQTVPVSQRLSLVQSVLLLQMAHMALGAVRA